MPEKRTDVRTWLFDFVTMVAVIIGVIYGAIEIRQLRQERERETLLALVSTVQTPEYIEAYQFVMSLPDTLTGAGLEATIGPNEDALLMHYLLTYESLGAMVYRGDVSMEWVVACGETEGEDRKEKSASCI